MTDKELQETLKSVTPDSSADSSAKETEEKVEAEVEAKDSESKAVDKPVKGGSAQERIQELVASRKSLESEINELKGSYSEAQKNIRQLTDLAHSRENDARIVAKINELHSSDPELAGIIEKLDKALKGENVKIEKATTPSTKNAESNVAQLLEQTRSKLEAEQEKLADTIANQEARMLLNQADQFIDSLVAKLPSNDYTDKDQEVLRTVLDERINWEAIEEDSDNLQKEISKAFQEAVEWYGDPRGKIKAASETQQKVEEKPKIPDIKELLNKEWGKLKPSGRKVGGKEVMEPVVSDAQFAAAAGELLRRNKG